MDDTSAARAFSALGNPVRLKIIRLLVRAGEAGANVGTLKAHANIPASTLAHHLATLRVAGLVKQQRQSREIMTTANYQLIDGLVTYLNDQCCTGIGQENLTGSTS